MKGLALARAKAILAFACAFACGCSRGMVPAMSTEDLLDHRAALIERLSVECAASAAHCEALHGALRNINNELRDRGVLR